MPTHLEDSDGNNADDDSIDSFMQRQNNFGYRESDDVPTRDVGPERLPNLFSQVKNSYVWTVVQILVEEKIFSFLQCF